MKAVISPSVLSGEITAVASKSQAHRLLICAALSDAECSVRCRTVSADIQATVSCLNGLGADIRRSGDSFLIKPVVMTASPAEIDCGESGSTLRFLLPVVCALGKETTIHMHGRLPDRPLSPLWEELVLHGAVLTRPTHDTIHVSGRLTGGVYTIAADISSQFISGLLFALPLTGEASRVEMTGRLESGSYIDMTAQALRQFGVNWQREPYGYSAAADTGYHVPEGEIIVEGDWSNAAFWICADRILGGTLSIQGLDPESLQGDRTVENVSLRIAAGSAVVDCRNIPDLVPVLSVLASVSPGQTVFTHAERLRIKESDRLAATASLINSLGGNAEETEDGLIITGTSRLSGGETGSVNDHRIAMSAAVASLACEGPVILHGAEAVSKSYPDFWKDFNLLGGHAVLEDEP